MLIWTNRADSKLQFWNLTNGRRPGSTQDSLPGLLGGSRNAFVAELGGECRLDRAAMPGIRQEAPGIFVKMGRRQ
jgi:hypothetical protein